MTSDTKIAAKSIAFHTLGCKLNYAETSTLSKSLLQNGFTGKNFNEPADVYVINTCSVTQHADKECAMLVRRVLRQNPDAKVVITGCYAQLKPQEIASIPGVDLVLGAAEKFNLPYHLEQLWHTDATPAAVISCDIHAITGFIPSYSEDSRTRTFLKVQDGCDYQCSFCTIPLARGSSRSNTIDGVLQNINDLYERGVKEVVLTGINLGDFGKTTPGSDSRDTSFYDLLLAIEHNTAMPRIRLSSVEPNLLHNSIIELVAQSNRFMPHFHIPLQSGSDAILAAMRRRYRTELYEKRIATIKQFMPHCCIGVDVIVGFPGETEDHFAETHRFLHQLDISYLHVFTYSERENTLAATMPNAVPQAVRNERNHILRNLSYQKMQYFTAQFAGTSRMVLWEKAEKNGTMSGYTDNYIKVSVPYREDWVNAIVECSIG
ncbi:MAG: tRNA (N(6)-L-threonylcarbamoyladenosine(37)-C(2))-methylthiotransferase MtaB [Chitinophagia bacterium]|nr:tRNA (N(6)-L-threonylcarbamoyladenosine(37)-C(2))-methylthiotransferase MtaB [Chitinophagia bacterium]